MSRRVLTGIQPSGSPHLGNWLGAIRPALAMQDRATCHLFIASYHAMTTLKEPGIMRNRVQDVAATWLALGLDPEKTTLWAQHDVPEVTELTWFLLCVTGMGMLEKAHAFKDAVANHKTDLINGGLYTYPVLMAADILAFDTDLVPVGKDQKQHIEMARDMAQSFHARFGEVFHLPEPLIQEEVATVVGLDGRKMSKSYGNAIELFLPSKQLRKRVMQIQTDSTPMEEPKDPDTCNVFSMYRSVASPAEVQALAARYRAPGMGYGHAKEELFRVLDRELAEPREIYQGWRSRPDDLQDLLHMGASRARKVAQATMERVKSRIGF
jgi:tryptophanyl-tRNA synthetase